MDSSSLFPFKYICMCCLLVYIGSGVIVHPLIWAPIYFQLRNGFCVYLHMYIPVFHPTSQVIAVNFNDYYVKYYATIFPCFYVVLLIDILTLTVNQASAFNVLWCIIQEINWFFSHLSPYSFLIVWTSTLLHF